MPPDCVAADGYFIYSDKPTAPHYVCEKALRGMLDAWVYCKNREARDAESRITDWAIKHLDRNTRSRCSSGDSVKDGHTLSEDLYTKIAAPCLHITFGRRWP